MISSKLCEAIVGLVLDMHNSGRGREEIIGTITKICADDLKR